MNKQADYDVIIAGGGMVGATLACLLAKQGSSVAVIEPYIPKPFSIKDDYGLRVSAISRFSQQAFMKVGAWEPILALRAAPYEAMHVWDATGQGEIHFDAAELGEPDLGYIIENQVVQAGLAEAMKQYDNLDFIPSVSAQSFSVEDNSVSVVLSDERVLITDLLVGADGANSKVRELAGIDVQLNDYTQKGLVAVVTTEKHHEYTAWQRFMPSGPLAFLPLGDDKISIVWTLPSDKADYHVAMSNENFNTAITEAFDYRLGRVTVLSERGAFPLVGRQAEQYVSEGVALIGDAAHTIHPLAGQGVNLGIKDAVELADVLAAANDRSHVSMKTLRRYERARRGDNVMTQKAMEGFKLLFGNTFAPLQLARNFGLSAVNSLKPVKNEVIRRAMGL